jgi:hypothetical protein
VPVELRRTRIVGVLAVSGAAMLVAAIIHAVRGAQLGKVPTPDPASSPR